MIGRLVKMMKVRDRGTRTHSDLTGPVIIEHRGELKQLHVGEPLIVELIGGKLVGTTPVESIRWLRLSAEGVPETVGHTMAGDPPLGRDAVDLLCEVATANTVYRLTVVAGRRRG